MMGLKINRKQNANLRYKAILLAILVLLPFLLYVMFFVWDFALGAKIVAGALTVSMAVLVWLG
jgi:TRAP-type mannitol/chloroaromatic compound transport system permease small subunit